jgi:hypothetical protein
MKEIISELELIFGDSAHEDPSLIPERMDDRSVSSTRNDYCSSKLGIISWKY